MNLRLMVLGKRKQRRHSLDPTYLHKAVTWRRGDVKGLQRIPEDFMVKVHRRAKCSLVCKKESDKSGRCLIWQMEEIGISLEVTNKS